MVVRPAGRKISHRLTSRKEQYVLCIAHILIMKTSMLDPNMRSDLMAVQLKGVKDHSADISYQYSHVSKKKGIRTERVGQKK